MKNWSTVKLYAVFSGIGAVAGFNAGIILVLMVVPNSRTWEAIVSAVVFGIIGGLGGFVAGMIPENNNYHRRRDQERTDRQH